MAKDKHVSETPATRYLRQNKAHFTEHPYSYVDRGGAAESARQLGIDLYTVAKTLIMEDDKGQPLIIIMHGDREVSTKNLARQIDAKKVSPCAPDVAERHSGYQVGGTSPFGTRKRMPVYIEQTLLQLDRIYINGGRRGYLIGIDPRVVTTLLAARPVQAGLA